MADITTIVIGNDHGGISITDTVTKAELTTAGAPNNPNTTFYIKPAIGLHDLFVSKLGRYPNINEKIDFIIESDVAIIGYKTVSKSNGKIIVGDRVRGAIDVQSTKWPNGVIVRTFTKGLVLGAGANSANYFLYKNAGIFEDWARLGLHGDYPIGDNGGDWNRNFDFRPYVLNKVGINQSGGGAGGIGHLGFHEYNDLARYKFGAVGGGGAPYGKAGISDISFPHPDVKYFLISEATDGGLLSGGTGATIGGINVTGISGTLANAKGGRGANVGKYSGEGGTPFISQIGDNWHHSGGTNTYGAVGMEVNALPPYAAEPKNETLSFTVGFKSTDRATATTKIIDTSVPNNNYSCFFSKPDSKDVPISQCQSGDTVYLVVDRSDYSESTSNLDFTWNNRYVNAPSSYQIKDTNVPNGRRYYSNIIVSDNTDGTDDTRTVSVAKTNNPSNILTSSSIIVKSEAVVIPVTYNSYWALATDINTPITEANEGTRVAVVFEASNVVGEIGVDSKFSGNGFVMGEDIDNNNLGTGGYTMGKVPLYMNIIADAKTEGDETITCKFNLRGGSKQEVTQCTLIVRDTSRTNEPTYEAGWYSSSSGITAITQINEGSTAWLIVKTTNVPNGTALSIRPDMRVSQDDFTDNTLNREAVIQNNIARVSYPIKADNMTEGDETFTVQVKLNTTTVATAGLVIKDTSVTPETTYNLRFVNSSSGTTDVSSVNEGGAIYLLVTTTNFPDGTLYVNLSGNGISADDVEGGNLIKPIAISGNSGRISWNILNDISTEGPETLTAKLTATNSMSDTVLAQDDLAINDTSTTVIENNYLLFTVGIFNGRYTLRGYDAGVDTVIGNLLNDTLKYNGQLLDSLASTIHYREDNGGLALQYWYNNYATIWENPLNFKITNMTTGEYYITGNVNGGHVTFNGVYWHDVPTASVGLLNRIYIPGQNVKVELI